MSRDKKTRRLKGKLNIKSGSKKNFIGDGELGKIPSKNKLAKHKNRPKSAFQKAMDNPPPAVAPDTVVETVVDTVEDNQEDSI